METLGQFTLGSNSLFPPKDFPPTHPTAFILSGNRILRETVAIVVAELGQIDVIGSSCDARHIAGVGDRSPNVLLLDAATHGNFENVSAIRDRFSGIRIVAFGLEDREDMILTCAKAGVAGFVMTDASLEDLAEAVHAAMRGELLCTPRVAGLLLSQVHRMASEIPAAFRAGILTAREQEIVLLMSEGLANKQIARCIKVQNATVKNHVHSILGKLGMHSRCEVVAQLRRSQNLDVAHSKKKADHALSCAPG